MQDMLSRPLDVAARTNFKPGFGSSRRENGLNAHSGGIGSSSYSLCFWHCQEPALTLFRGIQLEPTAAPPMPVYRGSAAYM